MKQEQFITVADGTKIRYLKWSNQNAAKRAVLIHSLAMNAEFWEPTVTALGPDWEVIAVDCRGHGQSDKPAGPYSVALFASDVAAVMDDAGWQDAVVGGASMGGCVALAFAEHHASRTSGLYLIDTTSWYGETAIDDWEERGQKALTGGMESMIGFQKTRWFSDSFVAQNDDVVDAAIAVFVANKPDAYLETCRMLGRCNQSHALASIAVPCRIVVGEQDYATPVAMATAMQAAIAGATLTVIPDVRHFTPLEVPDQIAAVLRQF
jgi:3-oxoadipate enol-lactonase